MTTVSEAGADKCPKCNQQMVEISKQPMTNPDDQAVIFGIIYHCQSEGCSWYGTGRFVTTDARGNIVARESGPRGIDKDFPKMSADALSRGKMRVEQYLRRRIEDDNNIPGSRPNDELPPDAV